MRSQWHPTCTTQTPGWPSSPSGSRRRRTSMCPVPETFNSFRYGRLHLLRATRPESSAGATKCTHCSARDEWWQQMMHRRTVVGWVSANASLSGDWRTCWTESQFLISRGGSRLSSGRPPTSLQSAQLVFRMKVIHRKPVLLGLKMSYDIEKQRIDRYKRAPLIFDWG